MSMDEPREMSSNIELNRIYVELDVVLQKAKERSDIRYSLPIRDDFDDADDWMEHHKEPTFQEELLGWIGKRGLSSTDFYGAAWMDRRLFSTIKNDVYYTPKKETAVACCLALQLPIQDAKDLLNKAGYELSNSRNWDLIIRYCIEHELYDIGMVNDLLNHYGERSIGT